MAHGKVKVLGNFIENLNCVLTQIRDESVSRKSNEDKNFNHHDYWDKMGKVFKAVSHEATKLSISYSSPPIPTPQESECLEDSASKALLAMVSMFYSLPRSQGERLHKSTLSAVTSILNNLKSLAESLSESASGSPDQMHCTGTVWEDADLFQTLPKDNKEVLLQEIVQSLSLVKDALQEIEEAVESGNPMDDLAEMLGEEIEDENESSWTESDKLLTGPCLGLVKTTKSVLKKTMESVKKNGQCDDAKNISELDSLGDIVNKFSPHVDDLILCLYPPIDRTAVQEHAKILYEQHKTQLEFLRHSHLTTEDDQKWVEFLQKANQHNYDKVLQSINSVT